MSVHHDGLNHHPLASVSFFNDRIARYLKEIVLLLIWILPW